MMAIGLAACGGGDGNMPANGGNATPQPGPSPTPSPTPTPNPSDKIRVEGTSKTVAADASGKLIAMLPPPPNNHYSDSANDPNVGFLKALPAAALSEAAPGAFTGVADDDGVQLTRGVVTDLAGNGQYAIGRWSDGTDSGGGQYNSYQGRVWAVGTPWPVTEPWADAFPTHTRFDCRLDAATRPIAIDGNTPPGKLDAAAASIFVVDHSEQPSPFIWPTHTAQMITMLRLGYSIGQDRKLFRLIPVIQGMGHSSKLLPHPYSLTTTMVGKDRSAPYLLVSYTLDSPTAGTVSGMAALACKMVR